MGVAVGERITYLKVYSDHPMLHLQKLRMKSWVLISLETI